MDPYVAIFFMIFGWIFLVGSWFLEDKWGTVIIIFMSMICFFISAGFFLWITIPYQFITSTDTIITGEQHLTGYQPLAIFNIGTGFLSLIWFFIFALFDMILPKLKEMGVK